MINKMALVLLPVRSYSSINRLNYPIDSQSGWMGGEKQDLNICCLQETHFALRTHIDSK